MHTTEKTLISKIILAQPRGFCAGVNRAIDIVDRALELYGSPLYVRHEIVHNHHVVNDFKKRGVIFIENLDEVPDNAMVIFSAHGTAPDVLDSAKNRGLKFIDAVCPLVTKVHLEIKRAIKDSRKVIYIGHKGHQEVLGAMGYAKENEEIFLVENIDDVDKLKSTLQNYPLMVATQTTLSLDDTAAIVAKLKKTFSDIEFPKSDDICYATQNRQDAVRELVQLCDYIFIIGSQNSSNTLRLLELARKLNKPAELVTDPDLFVPSEDLTGKVIGISSGASAPEFLVDKLISKLIGDENYSAQVEILNFKEEKIAFPLPVELAN